MRGIKGVDYIADALEPATADDLRAVRARRRQRRTGFPNHVYEELFQAALGSALEAYLHGSELAFVDNEELIEQSEKLYGAYTAAQQCGSEGAGFVEALDELEEALGEVDVALDPVEDTIELQLSGTDHDNTWSDSQNNLRLTRIALRDCAMCIKRSRDICVCF
jgi:hypothetical protein